MRICCVRSVTAIPSIVIHSFTATEILYFAEKEGITIEDTLRRLQDAGLSSLPGGGAEILVDRVRKLIAPKKIMTEDWLRVMRTAHKIGMESTATMVIGFGETMAERVEHMEHIRRLQEETGGFRAFITWTFQPVNTALGGEKTSSWDYMRTLAVTRLYMDNVAFQHRNLGRALEMPPIRDGVDAAVEDATRIAFLVSATSVVRSSEQSASRITSR